ncbi:hypothetical protein POF50_030185 [Streptomyces sp. SL13]|uniref:Uncharacterized protein n=1 Tax=Streptantibioticus silvisoli TaxID=2705255 RepID=A0AA90KJI0_9ACTN|nr:hypothetical protein [Streptantibioticus silvisoli]MDI5973559.1 hypothetical protein [Streptantibioticus silvisoli]
MHPIRLISFGYLHLHLPTDSDGRPILPTADRIEDVRDWLRDPAAARDILGMPVFTDDAPLPQPDAGGPRPQR